MISQFSQEYTAQEIDTTTNNTKVLTTAVFLGLLLGGMATMLLSGMSGLGLLGIWVLCMSIAWIGIAIVNHRLYKQAQWGMVVAGQAMGAVAIVMFIFAAI